MSLERVSRTIKTIIVEDEKDHFDNINNYFQQKNELLEKESTGPISGYHITHKMSFIGAITDLVGIWLKEYNAQGLQEKKLHTITPGDFYLFILDGNLGSFNDKSLPLRLGKTDIDREQLIKAIQEKYGSIDIYDSKYLGGNVFGMLAHVLLDESRILTVSHSGSSRIDPTGFNLILPKSSPQCPNPESLVKQVHERMIVKVNANRTADVN